MKCVHVYLRVCAFSGLCVWLCSCVWLSQNKAKIRTARNEEHDDITVVCRNTDQHVTSSDIGQGNGASLAAVRVGTEIWRS